MGRLIHTGKELVVGGGDLGGGLGRFREVAAHTLKRFPRGGGLPRLVHRLGSLLRGHDRRGRGFLHVPEDPLNLFGGLLGLLRQTLDLLGHHGEPPALLPRPGGLHGGVHRQEIGLFRQVFHSAGDVADFLALLAELDDGFRDERHLGADALDAVRQLFRSLTAALDQLEPLLGVLRHLPGLAVRGLRRGSDLFHAGGGLHHRH